MVMTRKQLILTAFAISAPDADASLFCSWRSVASLPSKGVRESSAATTYTHAISDEVPVRFYLHMLHNLYH